jgi:hypothetical protein
MPTERDYLIGAMMGEAGNQDAIGMALVADVLMNRAQSANPSAYGTAAQAGPDTIQGQLFAKSGGAPQFSSAFAEQARREGSVAPNRRLLNSIFNPGALSNADRDVYDRAASIADTFFNEQNPQFGYYRGIARGADYFDTGKSWAANQPWGEQNAFTHGGHTFRSQTPLATDFNPNTYYGEPQLGKWGQGGDQNYIFNSINQLMPGFGRGGQPEGPQIASKDPGAARELYLQMYPEIAERGEDPWWHYTHYGQNEDKLWTGGAPERNSNFDAGKLYLDQNPEVAAKGEDPWWHYTHYGQNEGKGWYGAAGATSDGNFDAGKLYLQQNPDIAAKGEDPWWHYQNFGKAEGRQWAKGGSNTGIGLTQDPGTGAYVPNVGGAGFISAPDLNGFPTQQWTPPPVPDVSFNPAAGPSTIPGAPGYTAPEWNVPSFGNTAFPGGVFGVTPLGGSGVSPSTVGPGGIANPFYVNPNSMGGGSGPPSFQPDIMVWGDR